MNGTGVRRGPGTSYLRVTSIEPGSVAERALSLEPRLMPRWRRDEKALALCWCGFDLIEHDHDLLGRGEDREVIAPIRDHAFVDCGTRHIRRFLHETHDHTHEQGIAFCLICRASEVTSDA